MSTLVLLILALLQGSGREPVRGPGLLVRVVDAQGKPCPGVQVALGSRMGSRGLPPDAMFNAPRVTEAASGTVRFLESSGLPGLSRHSNGFVRLGVPAEPPIEAPLSAASPSGEITLVMPECGEVLLRAPFCAEGTVQLRVAPPEEPIAPLWRSRQPPSLDLVQGVAHFEHVGLGLELEYRLVGPDLPTTLQGKFRGPTRRGEVVELTLAGLEELPALVATLVDGHLVPLGGIRFNWSIGIQRGNVGSSSGGVVPSDDAGRVRIPLDGQLAEPGARQLSIDAWSDEEAAKRIGNAYASVALPEDFVRGELDLGELIVVPFGSTARFRRTDDAALRRAYEAPVSGFSPHRDAGDPREEMLCEMIRRGGDEWESYLSRTLAALRLEKENTYHELGDLELLTTLRRLQGRLDPLRLVITPESSLDIRFPETPVAAFERKNFDVESFEIQDGFTACAIEGTGPDGRTLTLVDGRSAILSGSYNIEELAPGQSLACEVELERLAVFDRRGEYLVRLYYHGKELQPFMDVRGRIVSSTPPFVVRVRPLEIEITRQRFEETRGWIRELELGGRILLVRHPWRPGMSFRGEAATPEDRLFRAGWDAVPALLGAAKDASIEPKRRAWAFAMLWNLLGREDPSFLPRLDGLDALDRRVALERRAVRGSLRLLRIAHPEGNRSGGPGDARPGLARPRAAALDPDRALISSRRRRHPTRGARAGGRA